jgi:hypothetical protein
MITMRNPLPSLLTTKSCRFKAFPIPLTRTFSTLARPTLNSCLFNILPTAGGRGGLVIPVRKTANNYQRSGSRNRGGSAASRRQRVAPACLRASRAGRHLACPDEGRAGKHSGSYAGRQDGGATGHGPALSVVEGSLFTGHSSLVTGRWPLATGRRSLATCR